MTAPQEGSKKKKKVCERERVVVIWMDDKDILMVEVARDRTARVVI